MEDSSGGWLTYQEAGDRLGVSAEAARAKAARRRWRRQVGNDGLARVLLPGDLPLTTRARESGDQPVTPRSPPGRKSADAALIKILEAHITLLREQLTAAETRLGAADAREAEYIADLVAKRATTAKAIEAFAALAYRLDQLAAERARRLVAPAGGLMAMSIEGWIQRWKLAQVFFEWQTLIAGALALVAALITVRMIGKQTATTVRLERERDAGARLRRQGFEIRSSRVPLSDVVARMLEILGAPVPYYRILNARGLYPSILQEGSE